MKNRASRDTACVESASSKAAATATAQNKQGDAGQPLTAQLQSSERMTAQRKQLEASFGTQAAPNKTGMPDALKSGVESLSGMDMSSVRVHHNSDKPEQLDARAYAQGNDIHLGPGQEEHLPHEAWHVVQQRQGRVQATTQLQGVSINDDTSLESEADVMGARALQSGTPAQRKLMSPLNATGSVLQGVFKKFGNQKGTFEGDPGGFHIHRVGGDEHFKYGKLQWTRVDFIEGGNLLPKKLDKAIEMCSGLVDKKGQKIDETYKDVVLTYMQSLVKEEEKPAAVEEHKADKEDEPKPKDEEPQSGGSPYAYGDVGTTSNKNVNTEEDFW